MPVGKIVRAGLLCVLLLGLVACGGSKKDKASGTPEEQALAKRWWVWAAMENDATNPVTDVTGIDCQRNQPSDVFFLANGFEKGIKRTCKVPAGRKIFAPVFTLVCPEDDATCAFEGVDTSVNLKATKGKLPSQAADVTDIDNPPFNLQGAETNPITTTADPVRVTTKGTWVTIPPLKPGTYTLTLDGKDKFGTESGVTYTLTVS